MIKLIVKETEEKSYPKFMINEDKDIVFFIRENYGLPINGNLWANDNMLVDNWNMEDFIDYNEEITLQNM